MVVSGRAFISSSFGPSPLSKVVKVYLEDNGTRGVTTGSRYLPPLSDKLVPFRVGKGLVAFSFAAYSCHGRWFDAEGTQFVIATQLAPGTTWTSESNRPQPYRNSRRLCFMYKESGGVVSLTASEVACQRGIPPPPPMLAFNATSTGEYLPPFLGPLRPRVFSRSPTAVPRTRLRCEEPNGFLPQLLRTFRRSSTLSRDFGPHPLCPPAPNGTHCRRN